MDTNRSRSRFWPIITSPLYIVGLVLLIWSAILGNISRVSPYAPWATNQLPIEDRWQGISASDAKLVTVAIEYIKRVQSHREERIEVLCGQRSKVGSILPYLPGLVVLLTAILTDITKGGSESVWSGTTSAGMQKSASNTSGGKQPKKKLLWIVVVVLGTANAFLVCRTTVLTNEIDDLRHKVSDTKEDLSSNFASLNSGNANAAKTGARSLREEAKTLKDAGE